MTLRYIGGYQTRIDCVDYETFTKWAKEKVSEENSYQKCYEKGLNDAKRKQTPVRVCCDKEIRNETIERILEIIDREKNQWQNLTSQEEVILFQAYKDLQTAVKELRGG